MSEHHAADLIVPPPPRTGATFPILDTLRAVGAVAVLTTHVTFWSGDYTRHGVLGTLFSRLDVGVAIFFVLSGFLLGRPWLVAAARASRWPAAAAYFWKRAVRILPLYVVVAVPTLWLIEANRSLGLGDRLAAVLLVSTVRGPTFPDGLTHMWSLAVEVAFYLVLPLLMAALVGRRPRAARLAAGLLTLAAVTIWWHLAGATWVAGSVDGNPQLWLPGYLTWFAVGIGLAAVQVRYADGTRSRCTEPVIRLARLPGACWAIAAGLLLVAATPLAGPALLAAPTGAEALTKNLLYAAIGGVVVLTGVFADPAGHYHRLMTHPVPRRLGWISYGIFCVHLPLLHGVMWATGWPLFEGRGPAIWLVTVAASLIVAELAYRVVERPALRLKGLVPERPAATNTPTSGTSIR